MTRFPLAALALGALPAAAAAQTGPQLTFEAGLGARIAPDYFGSEDYGTGATGSFSFGHARIGGLEFGDPDPDAVALGFRPRGSVRLVGERTADDNPELAGMEDIDFSVELGGGIAYQGPDYFYFADLRYGVIGHESLVAEVGADAIFRVGDRLTLTAGPRALWGSEDYTATYFGVTAAEAGNSAFDAYAPDSGLVSYGVELGASYAFTDAWSLDASVNFDHLTGDAADSPLVQDQDSYSASLVLMRRFSFGY